MQDDTDLDTGSGLGLALKFILGALAIIGAITIVGWVISAAAGIIKLAVFVLVLMVVAVVVRAVLNRRS
jgi:hypothetical protein